MARTKTLVVRASENEMAAFEAMAQMDKLPVGTFIRQRMLFEADSRGIMLDSGKANRTSKILADSSAIAVS